MTAIVAAIVAFLKIVGIVLDKVDAASKAKIQKALLDAARMEVEDEIAERARAAYRARMSAGVRDTYDRFRD